MGDIGRIRECPERFRKEDSWAVHYLPGSMMVFIDALGRPEWSYMDVPVALSLPMKVDTLSGHVSVVGLSVPT
jgi:hypothetical protein